jgi:hypothetical protein
VHDDGVVLEVSPGVLVRFAKAAVGRIVDAEDTEQSDDADGVNDADDVSDADTDATSAATTSDAEQSDVAHDQAGRGRTSAGE